MVFGIGDVKGSAIQSHSLGMIERGRLKAAIGKPDLAAADHLLDRSVVERKHDYPIVIRIGDEQLIRLFVRENLAGKRQHRGWRTLAFKPGVERPPVDKLFGVEGLDHLCNDPDRKSVV